MSLGKVRDEKKRTHLDKNVFLNLLGAEVACYAERRKIEMEKTKGQRHNIRCGLGRFVSRPLI